MIEEERKEVLCVFKKVQEIGSTSEVCDTKMKLELQILADIAYQLTRIADGVEAVRGISTQQLANQLKYVGRTAFRVYLDGDQYCATMPDFINLQESPVGFGNTILDAINDLDRMVKNEHKIRTV